jgi:hypothetical protein
VRDVWWIVPRCVDLCYVEDVITRAQFRLADKQVAAAFGIRGFAMVRAGYLEARPPTRITSNRVIGGILVG